MIKLQDILNEQEFKAKSKETGRVVVFKSKENMEKAFKAGTAEPLDKKKMSGKDDKVKGQDMFAKDIEKKKPMKSVRKDTISRRHEDTKETLDDLRDEYQEAKEMGDREEMDKIGRMHNLYKNHAIAQELTLDVIETQGDFNIDKLKEVVTGGPEKTSHKDFEKAISEISDLIAEMKTDKESYDKSEVKKLRNLIEHLKSVRDIQKWVKEDNEESDRDDQMFQPTDIRDVKENTMKLKSLLKETKVWERKFGEPLPTLNSVMEKHQQNQLNESPISVLKPARVEKKSIVYGYITLQPYYNQIRKTWKELKSLLDRIDYVAIDFDDRNESLKAVTDLPGWRDPFIREPMIKSFRNFTKFVNNPKNMKEPERVQNAIKKNIRQSALPKWIQLTNLYKQYLKFNNKKVSSVFPATKGKKIGQKRIGDFGGFTLTENVHKLFTNQSGFTQTNMRDAFEQMDWLIKNRYKKMIVQGPRD